MLPFVALVGDNEYFSTCLPSFQKPRCFPSLAVRIAAAVVAPKKRSFKFRLLSLWATLSLSLVYRAKAVGASLGTGQLRLGLQPSRSDVGIESSLWRA
jgi:hypothetical protein